MWERSPVSRVPGILDHPSLIEQPRLASPDSLINIRSARDWPSGRRYSSMRHNPARLRSGYLEMQVRPSIYHRWRPFYWQHVLLDFRHFNPCHLEMKTSNSHNHNHLDWIVTGLCSLFPRKPRACRLPPPLSHMKQSCVGSIASKHALWAYFLGKKRDLEARHMIKKLGPRISSIDFPFRRVRRSMSWDASFPS